MSLDCNTPRGRVYISHQADCARRLASAWNCDVFMTKDTEAADVDAIAVRARTVAAVMEIKTREMDLWQLKRFGSYLITQEKLVKLSEMAARLSVPGFLVVSLLHDQRIVYWKICDETGALCVETEDRVTSTQAICNGGLTDRLNAYISLNDMRLIVQ